MKKIFLLFSILLFLASCSSESYNTFSIARDKNWYASELNGEEKNVDGFVMDVLLEIAKDRDIEIELVNSSWDNLFLNLNKKHYEAVLSSLEPYNFNRAKYSFSKDLLKIGYSLIVLKDSKISSLKELNNKHVGYLKGDSSITFLQAHDEIFDEGYTNIPQMLDDIISGKIKAGIISIIPAYKYVSDLYYDYLKISNDLLSDNAIRLITLKNKNKRLLNIFNSSLQKLERSGKLKKLKEKWGFPDF